nr:MAG TPA_asm: hypothetical protein [Bacteriophage sp.]DAP05613.1 MAG TPA: hypothetical protein [Caudoviricetes sp.]
MVHQITAWFYSLFLSVLQQRYIIVLCISLLALMPSLYQNFQYHYSLLAPLTMVQIVS